MAWETRHVKIPALNDSQYIGVSVYSVVITSAIVVVLANLIAERVTLAFITITALILTSTTATLSLLFLPKINDIWGKGKFVYSISLSTTLGRYSWNVGKAKGNVFFEIKRLLKLCQQNSETNLIFYSIVRQYLFYEFWHKIYDTFYNILSRNWSWTINVAYDGQRKREKHTNSLHRYTCNLECDVQCSLLIV